jgi:hypothetical protein
MVQKLEEENYLQNDRDREKHEICREVRYYQCEKDIQKAKEMSKI